VGTRSIVVAEAPAHVSERQTQPRSRIVLGCDFVVASDRCQVTRLFGDHSGVPREGRDGLTFSARVT